MSALPLVDMDVAIAVMVHRVTVRAVMMDAMSAFVLDLVLVFLVMAVAVMRGAAGCPATARHLVGAVLGHATLGAAAMPALRPTAVREFFLLVFGLAFLG